MRILFGLMVALTPIVAWSADTLSSRIESYFSEMESLRGGFHQQVRDGSGRLIEDSYGTLLIQRPGKFRWQTSVPFVQEIVGDGSRIWLHDPDLEQVTVRKQQGSLANTPAALLTGEGSLKDQFAIHPIGKKQYYEWAELVSIHGSGGFEQLLVAMDDEQLRVIEVEDSLGQRTRIDLQDMLYNPSLEESNFLFVPPAGTDVVGDFP
ncbi:MAG: outer membrane lipoprotein chaperone LolA [Gammaproteobacteria bacterium]|uniref:Outer-membrane lipoprotein carrier protein n=1 Tax=Candidatus Thiopontia autotrophica TaxID=2841688 RepID=A0A8J6P9J6_9GAMM|nr:outer membrane lipoprotein chaperone LolA [Candidatus Thiopontia autotrophica]